MDTGQMMTVMQQMPVNTSTAPIGEAAVPADQAGRMFAGLLEGLSMQKPAQVSAAGQGVQPVMAGMQGTEIATDLMTALLTNAGSGTAQVRPVQPEAQVKKTDQETPEPESQNVMLDGSMAQLALLLTQSIGRMPVAEIPEENLPAPPTANSPAERVGSTTVGNSHVNQNSRGVPTLVSTPPVPTAVIAATAVQENLQDALPVNEAAAVQSFAIAKAVQDGGLERLTASRSSGSIPVTPQKEGRVFTEGDGPVSAPQGMIQRHAEVLPSVMTESTIRQSELSPAQADSPLRPAPDSQVQQRRVLTSPVGVEANPVFTATPPLPASAAVERIVVGTENRVLQLDPQEMTSRLATLPPVTETSVSPGTGAQNAKTTESLLQQAGGEPQQEQLQKVRSSAVPAFQPVVAANTSEGRTEMGQARIEPQESARTQLSELTGAVKNSSAAPSGEKNASGGENESSDRGMTGNFLSHVLHQQAKSEGQVAVSGASGAVQDEVSRTNIPSEQVVQQVRERFTTHETKPGSEQIVLRLSPDHLGELKVNLNLEGQRLKVEIVAENRMVRDSLMQHTDALKESLSRQNIKMESFEVTTGGSNTAAGGRNQADWRELAQQRQQHAWMPEGGYRLAKQVPPVAAYQVKSEHTMVDLHF